MEIVDKLLYITPKKFADLWYWISAILLLIVIIFNIIMLASTNWLKMDKYDDLGTPYPTHTVGVYGLFTYTETRLRVPSNYVIESHTGSISEIGGDFYTASQCSMVLIVITMIVVAVVALPSTCMFGWRKPEKHVKLMYMVSLGSTFFAFLSSTLVFLLFLCFAPVTVDYYSVGWGFILSIVSPIIVLSCCFLMAYQQKTTQGYTSSDWRTVYV